MQAIIVGGDSKLGRALGVVHITRGHKVVMTTRRSPPSGELVLEKLEGVTWAPLDLLEPRFPLLPVAQFNVVYLVAAVTGVVQCERAPLTWRVNADAPVLLAAAARYWDWQVVFVSSDAVEVAPHTAYAMQKAHAEAAIMAMGGHVVRPARIAPEKYTDVAKVMVLLGEQSFALRHATLTRWEG